MATLTFSLKSFVFVFFLKETVAGNGRYFITDSCGKQIGPDFGAYLEFDRDSSRITDGTYIPQHLKGKELKCTVTIRGMPTSGEKRYMSIYWRNFRVRDPLVESIQKTPEKCKRAYVTVHTKKDIGSGDTGETFCGPGAIPTHLEWTGEYATIFFYIDYRTPKDKNKTYPEVFFKADVTSFDYECKNSKENVVLQCKQSKRCLDDSLRCDYWFSRNCQSERFPRDNTDTSKHPPGNCFKITTTTTTTPAPVRPLTVAEFMPMFIGLGVLSSLFTCLWCCCRPGYLPWRLSRLRNSACIQYCGECLSCSNVCRGCCSSCCPEFEPRPTGPAAFRMMKQLEDFHDSMGTDSTSLESRTTDGRSWIRQSTVFPLRTSSSKDFNVARDSINENVYQRTSNSSGTKQRRQTATPGDINFAVDWIKCLTSDGGHLREHR